MWELYITSISVFLATSCIPLESKFQVSPFLFQIFVQYYWSHNKKSGFINYHKIEVTVCIILYVSLFNVLKSVNITLQDECDHVGCNTVWFGRSPPKSLQNICGLLKKKLHNVTTEKTALSILTAMRNPKLLSKLSKRALDSLWLWDLSSHHNWKS